MELLELYPLCMGLVRHIIHICIIIWSTHVSFTIAIKYILLNITSETTNRHTPTISDEDTIDKKDALSLCHNRISSSTCKQGGFASHTS